MGHFVHSLAALDEYVPGGHVSHAAPAPAPLVPGAQSSHDVAASVLSYSHPGSGSVGGLKFLVVASSHAARVDAPDVPAGHAVHELCALPTLVENVPTPQGLQYACPPRFWYHPAGHSTHSDSPSSGCTVPAEHGSHKQL